MSRPRRRRSRRSTTSAAPKLPPLLAFACGVAVACQLAATRPAENTWPVFKNEGPGNFGGFIGEAEIRLLPVGHEVSCPPEDAPDALAGGLTFSRWARTSSA